MTIFEYFMVLLSVVLSLALTELVSGVADLARRAKEVRWSLVHILWVIVGFSMVLDLWASLWLVRDVARWRLGTLVFMLLQATSVYVYNSWVIPRDRVDMLDLRAFQVQARRLYLGAFIFYCICGVITNAFILPNGAFEWANYTIAAPMIVSAAAAWIWRANWVQAGAALVVVGLMLFYFATSFGTIG